MKLIPFLFALVLPFQTEGIEDLLKVDQALRGKAFEKAVKLADEAIAKSPKNELRYNFVEDPFVEIKGSIANKYSIEFIDQNNDKVIHKSEISNNMWVKCSKKYYTDWKIVVKPLNPSSFKDKIRITEYKIIQ